MRKPGNRPEARLNGFNHQIPHHLAGNAAGGSNMADDFAIEKSVALESRFLEVGSNVRRLFHRRRAALKTVKNTKSDVPPSVVDLMRCFWTAGEKEFNLSKLFTPKLLNL
jgi:hypothetical protein